MATGREREAPIFRLDSENKIRAPYTAFLYIASPSSKKKVHTGSGLARSGPAAGKQTAAGEPGWPQPGRRHVQAQSPAGWRKLDRMGALGAGPRFAGARLLGPTGSRHRSPLPGSAPASSGRPGSTGRGPEAQPAFALGNTSGQSFAPWSAATRAAHPGDALGTARPRPLSKATRVASNPHSVPQFDLLPQTQRKAETKSAK